MDDHANIEPLSAIQQQNPNRDIRSILQSQITEDRCSRRMNEERHSKLLVLTYFGRLSISIFPILLRAQSLSLRSIPLSVPGGSTTISRDILIPPWISLSLGLDSARVPCTAGLVFMGELIIFYECLYIASTEEKIVLKVEHFDDTTKNPFSHHFSLPSLFSIILFISAALSR